MADETILEFLQRMRRKDIGKGYEPRVAGIRTTREIADFMGWSPGQARRQLARMEAEDLVEDCGQLECEPGQPHCWRAL